MTRTGATTRERRLAAVAAELVRAGSEKERLEARWRHFKAVLANAADGCQVDRVLVQLGRVLDEARVRLEQQPEKGKQ